MILKLYIPCIIYKLFVYQTQAILMASARTKNASTSLTSGLSDASELYRHLSRDDTEPETQLDQSPTLENPLEHAVHLDNWPRSKNLPRYEENDTTEFDSDDSPTAKRGKQDFLFSSPNIRLDQNKLTELFPKLSMKGTGRKGKRNVSFQEHLEDEIPSESTALQMDDTGVLSEEIERLRKELKDKETLLKEMREIGRGETDRMRGDMMNELKDEIRKQVMEEIKASVKQLYQENVDKENNPNRASGQRSSKSPKLTTPLKQTNIAPRVEDPLERDVIDSLSLEESHKVIRRICEDLNTPYSSLLQYVHLIPDLAKSEKHLLRFANNVHKKLYLEELIAPPLGGGDKVNEMRVRFLKELKGMEERVEFLEAYAKRH